nr:formate/nitrite transporter family protein [Brachybacterium muris]
MLRAGRPAHPLGAARIGSRYGSGPAAPTTGQQRPRHQDELLDEAVSTVAEGAERLNRKWPELIITGLFGGIDVGLGILAMVLVKQATDSDILAGMAFGVGLLALKLAHSELFTEEFLLPLNAVIAGQGTWWQVVRLWAVSLVTNLAGGLAFAWLIVVSLPGYHDTIIGTAHKYLDQDSLPVMIGLSLLAGATITLSTRMQQGTSNDVVTALVCLVSGLLVIALPRVIRTWRILGALRRDELTLEQLEEQAEG